MLRKILLPLLLLSLLYGLFAFQVPHSAARLSGFILPPVLSPSPVLTQDTTRLPAVQFVPGDRPVSAELRGQLVKGIHFLYKFYITRFDYAFPEDFAVKIRVFRDYEAYKRYTARVAPDPMVTHIGLYVHRLQEIVVWQGPETSRFIKTVFHETSHLLLRSQSNFCPRWLNEGMSEYFEELDVTGPVAIVHPQPLKDGRLQKRFAQDQVPTLYSFLAQTNQEWVQEDNQSDAPRTISWSLIYFLMRTHQGQLLVKDLLHYYNQENPDSEKSLQTFSQFVLLNAVAPSFQTGSPLRALERDWKNWVKGQKASQSLALRPLTEGYLDQLYKWVAVNWE